MANNAVKIHESDNVVIATHPIGSGESVVVDGNKLLKAAEKIEAGHKIALVSIGIGEVLYRYGEPIVEATAPIAPGQWVHVHNTQPIPGHLEE